MPVRPAVKACVRVVTLDVVLEPLGPLYTSVAAALTASVAVPTTLPSVPVTAWEPTPVGEQM